MASSRATKDITGHLYTNRSPSLWGISKVNVLHSCRSSDSKHLIIPPNLQLCRSRSVMAAPKSTRGHQARPKKIIVCSDGTWENSLAGDGTPLTNVTRISRALKRTCEDGTSQVIYYHPGVGTGGLWVNSITGGVFGMGLAEVCVWKTLCIYFDTLEYRSKCLDLNTNSNLYNPRIYERPTTSFAKITWTETTSF